MSERGKTINIYLEKGSPTGIKHVELDNWSGQVIICPKTLLKQLAGWEESHKTGVYLLMGEYELTTKRQIYIGEADDVRDRLNRQASDKDFWEQVFILTSKDENLTKAHAKYLESRMIEQAHEADRAVLKNNIAPRRASLPRRDRDTMEEYLDCARIILATLGFPYLQPANAKKLKKQSPKRPKPPTPPKPPNPRPEKASMADIELYLHEDKNQVSAQGFIRGQEFVVLSGSRGSKDLRDSARPKIKGLRRKLISEEKIDQLDDCIRLNQNVSFDSSSEAATLICGSPRSGPAIWKDVHGTTLKELQKALSDARRTSPSSTAKQKADKSSGSTKRSKAKRKQKSTSAKTIRIKQMFRAGLIKAGDELCYRNVTDRKAVLVDEENCQFEGQLTKVNDFARQVSERERGINIYREVIHVRTGKSLGELRDQLKRNS